MSKLPRVSIVIPTLNAQSVLKTCLRSISMQDYPSKNIEIIISDGGSADKTLEIAEKYGARIYDNRLKTGEAGKALGVRKATGEYVALVDSDNILPTKNWVKQMILPLTIERDAIGSEPIKYTHRKKDGFITRYCALIGMNDPFVHFLGNYDRMNLLSGTWTKVQREEKEKKKYLLVKFKSLNLPTIGANGTVYRTDFLRKNLKGSYLFDIDMLAKQIKDKGEVTFIKVKNGIVHTYCERDISKFATKQRRRVRDYMFHLQNKNRTYDWNLTRVSKRNINAYLRFIIYCVTIIPLFAQSLYGYSKKKDLAWFFHPLACLITLWEYGVGVIISFFEKSELSREGWKQ